MQFTSYLSQLQKYKRNFKLNTVLFITTSHFMQHVYQYILSNVEILYSSKVPYKPTQTRSLPEHSSFIGKSLVTLMTIIKYLPAYREGLDPSHVDQTKF